MSGGWQTLSSTGQPTPELHKPGRSNLSSLHVCLTPDLSKDKVTLCLSCGVSGCLTPCFCCNDLSSHKTFLIDIARQWCHSSPQINRVPSSQNQTQSLSYSPWARSQCLLRLHICSCCYFWLIFNVLLLILCFHMQPGHLINVLNNRKLEVMHPRSKSGLLIRHKHFCALHFLTPRLFAVAVKFGGQSGHLLLLRSLQPLWTKAWLV